MAITFDEMAFPVGQSSAGALLFVPLTGTTTFTGTEQLSGSVPVTIDGTFNQPGDTVTIDLNLVGSGLTAGATGTYVGFSAAPNSTEFVYYFSVTAEGLPTPVAVAVTNATQLPPLNVATQINTSAVNAPAGPNTPCFATGTRIRTVRGDLPVEDLAAGDEIVTFSGAVRPIVWIGHRRTDCANHPLPHGVMPIRIRAGAVAPGMPARDLLVSPGHKLFFDGILVDAEFLVNGSTVVRDTVDEITYWHVELDEHDILLAEGMPAESYLDCANRAAFDNAPGPVSIHPDFTVDEAALLCAPVVRDGARLHAVRAWLQARARHLGVRTVGDTGLQLIADGLPLTPVAVRDGRFEYEVPADAEELRLVSRAGVPQELQAESSDARRLGLRVSALMLDGVHVAIDDPRLRDGWYDAEEGSFRWTNGNAALPVARWIAITASGLPSYPVSGQDLPATQEVARPPAPSRRFALVG